VIVISNTSHAVILELEEVHSIIPSFVIRKFVKNTSAVEQLGTILDIGEAEAIILGEELHADYLLIDETGGRKIARQRGLKVIGLLGVLKLPKDKGFISAIKPLIDLIDALQTDAGFWIFDRVTAACPR